MKKQTGQMIAIAAAASAGGGLAAVIPLSLFELGATTIGLSEIMPAFAPPLGGTAQKLIIAIGVFSGALLAAIIILSGKDSADRDKHEGTSMSPLFSRLTSFARNLRSGSGRSSQDEEAHGQEEVPVLRRSDSHPDAPSRAPLFARRELGEEMLPPVAGPANDADWDEKSAKKTKHAADHKADDSIAARRMARIRGDIASASTIYTPPAPTVAEVPEVTIADEQPTMPVDAIAEPIVEQAMEVQPESVPEHKPLVMKQPEDEVDIAMPRAPEPLPWHLIEEEMSRIMNGGAVSVPGHVKPAPEYKELVAEEPAIPRPEDMPLTPQSVLHQTEELVPEAIAPVQSSPQSAPLQYSEADNAGIYVPDLPPVVAPMQADVVRHDINKPEPALAISQLVDRLEQGLVRRYARRAEGKLSSEEKADSEQKESDPKGLSPLIEDKPSVRVAPAMVAVPLGRPDEYDTPSSSVMGNADDLQRALAALRATTAKAS